MNQICRSNPPTPQKPIIDHPTILHLNLSSMPLTQPPYHTSFINLLQTGLSSTVTLPCSKANPLALKADTTPSIHPLCGLPLPHPPSTPESYIFFAILLPSKHSTWPNHLSTQFSALPAKSLITPTSLFIFLLLCHECKSLRLL